MSKWKSCAEWPEGVYTAPDGSHVSKDTHDTREAAKAVCGLLTRQGFGGEGRHFPRRTWVEPDLGSSPIEVEVKWHPASQPPEHENRILVHVVDFEGRPDTETVQFGRYIKSLQEWRVEGSPSSWKVDWWAEVPHPWGNCDG